MLFNSLSFLYLFLPITYFVFWRLCGSSQRYVWLTITGYVFYGFWNYKFCALMALSTAVSYLAGLGLRTHRDQRWRRMCLVAPIVIDLGLLGFFKYTNFALETLSPLAELLHVQVPQELAIVLPVGISFYTFHTITYIVDSYRGTITPTRNFFEFSCYVSLFAQLVAGPIVRFRQIEADLERIGDADQGGIDQGWSLFCLGLFKKLLIADTLAGFIDPQLAHVSKLSTLSAWACMLGYTYQLYFDFSGYSDMATGLGRLFGLGLPPNFNSPYKALDPSDFWRRWHICLSTVLRDYLYIPLGGNRRGRTVALGNLMITMLLGGLWHGASWTFVVWGGYHGLLLALHRLLHRAWERLPELSRRAITFFLVVVGWVFFRAEDMRMAGRLLETMFSWRPGSLVGGQVDGRLGDRRRHRTSLTQHARASA